MLYGRDIPVKPEWVQLAGAGAVAALWLTGWGSGYYTNLLLVNYVLMVVAVIRVYRFRPGFQPVCLAFLIVFVNSFFWEAPIHAADLAELDNTGTVLLQTVGHLYPLPFLLGTGFTPPRRWWYWSVAVWTVVLGLTYFRLTGALPSPWRLVSLYLSRWLGLLTLTWILRYPGQPENRIIYTVRNILNDAKED